MIVLYSIKNSKLHLHKKQMNAHEGILTCLTFGSGMSNGLLFSGGTDNKVKIWNASNLECIGELQHHSKKIMALCHSGDGRYIASAGADNKVFVYDITKNCKMICKVETKEKPVSITFHHTSVIIGLMSGACQVWNVLL